MSTTILSTRQAAGRVGMTQEAIDLAIRKGRLRAQRFANVYAIEESDLEEFKSTHRLLRVRMHRA